MALDTTATEFSFQQWIAWVGLLALSGCALKDDPETTAKLRFEIQEPYPAVSRGLSESSALGMLSMVPIQPNWYNQATCLGLNLMAPDIGPDPRFYQGSGGMGFDQFRFDRERGRLGPTLSGVSSCTYPSRYLSPPIQLPLSAGSTSVDFVVPKGAGRLFQVGAFYDPERKDYCGGMAGQNNSASKGMKVFEVARAVKDVFRDDDVRLVNSYPPSYLGEMQKDMNCSDDEMRFLQFNPDGSPGLIAWYQADRYEPAFPQFPLPTQLVTTPVGTTPWWPTSGVFGPLVASPTSVSYVATGLGATGQPAVRALRVGAVSSTANYLETPSASLPPATNFSQFTIAVAVRMTSSAFGVSSFVTLCENSACSGTTIAMNMSSSTSVIFNYSGGGTVNIPSLTSPFPYLADSRIVIFIGQGYFANTAPIINAFGPSSSTLNTWTSNSGTSASGTPSSIAARYLKIGGSGSANNSNDILEVMVYSSALQGGTLTKLQNYLQTKYQL